MWSVMSHPKTSSRSERIPFLFLFLYAVCMCECSHRITEPMWRSEISLQDWVFSCHLVFEGDLLFLPGYTLQAAWSLSFYTILLALTSVSPEPTDASCCISLLMCALGIKLRLLGFCGEWLICTFIAASSSWFHDPMDLLAFILTQ